MSLFPEEEERIRGREQGEGVEEARRYVDFFFTGGT